ncbi:hypothetical protein [uncultured Psychroserpens sp.]|uniref:hypothetical protein n=1 Tax=uncultured Psychroserpens sp. TaxID=255436 RepID=UPI002627C792|nr:hypothetical protein [uncultured Psychroserpens sp.]
MKTQLLKAIDHLYDTFKSYTILGNLRDRSCDCCVFDTEIKMLLSKPIKSLDKDDIYHFMTSAMTTFGDVEDYKHFLPRILELVIFSADVREDFLTFEKLDYAKWEGWEAKEIKAIKSVLECALIQALNENSEHIDGFISLNLLYNDFETLSKILLESDSEKLISNIVDKALTGYSQPINERLAELYAHPKILEKIEQHFLNTTHKEEANRLSIAYSLLENKN